MSLAPTLGSGARKDASATPTVDAAHSVTYRVLAAALIGAGAAAIGFPPVVNLIARLGIDSHPGRVFGAPAVLLTIAATFLAWHLGPPKQTEPRRPLSRSLAVALVAIGVGVLVSLLGSRSPGLSAAEAGNALLAPALLYLVLRRGALPAKVLAGAWLWVITLFLIRADAVFFRLHGFPTPSYLFHEKSLNVPYDFHYYTLGNPDHTGTFLLLPFAVSLFWSLGREGRGAKLALAFVAALTLLNIYLTYTRSALVCAGVLVVIACATSPYRKSVRIAGAVALVAVAMVLTFASPHHGYFANLFSSDPATSTGVRVSSIEAGWKAFLHHPVTGVGFGQFGNDAAAQLAGYSGGITQAHSSVIQAAAELGILGLVGFAVATAVLLAGGGRAIWRRTLKPRDAALIALAAYALLAAAAGGANEGVMVGFVSVYAIGIALVAVLAEAPQTSPHTDSQRLFGGLRLGNANALGLSRIVPVLATVIVGVLLGVTTHWTPGSVSSSISSSRGAPNARLTLASPVESASFRLPPTPYALVDANSAATWRRETSAIKLSSRSGKLLVTTIGGPYRYQLWAPPLRLSPGRYVAYVRGAVLSGGMALGVLDDDNDRWITNPPFRSRTYPHAATFLAGFELRHTTSVHLILQNYAPSGEQSRWSLTAAGFVVAPASLVGPAR